MGTSMPSNSSDHGGTREHSGRPPLSRPQRGAGGLVLLSAAIGVAAVLVAEQADRYFSSNEFCISCHSMKENPYKQFKESKHGKTATGVQPTCAHCHISPGLVPAWVDHFLGTKDLFAELSEDFSKAETYEKALPKMADTVRMRMLADGSRNCLKCHVMAAIRPEKKRGQAQHREALEKGNSNCIACHQNVAHKEIPLSETFTKAAEKYQ
jgi:nitrate/TMAO reductase-like tetraheme cytochrome c subunit